MLLEIAQAIVADVKARHSEGDCPITRQHSVTNLEDALLTIATTPSPSPVSAPSHEETASGEGDGSSENAAQRQSPAGGVREAGDLRDVLMQARRFVVFFLAFVGRDRGTDRFEKTLDDLTKLAVAADEDFSAKLAALSSPATPKPVSAPANGEVVSKLDISPEWFEKRGRAEGDLEISAGAREPLQSITGTVNPSPEQIAEYERLAFEALPQWAQNEITRLRALSNPAPGREAVPRDAALRLRQQLEQRLQAAVVNADATGVPVDHVLATATVGVSYADLAALIHGGGQ